MAEDPPALTVASLAAAVAGRWPELVVDAAELEAALAERELPLSSPHAADVALACALARSEASALNIFEAELVPVQRAALRRFGQGEDFTDEAVQRVRIKLLTAGEETPRIIEYRARGPLEAWLQIIALREGQMLLRGSRRTISDDEALFQLAASDPVLRETREELKQKLAGALREALEALEPRRRTLLRMCLIEGASTREVGRIYGVHRVTVFRWLREAREELLGGTRARFQAAAGISDSEIDSLMRSLAPSLSISW